MKVCADNAKIPIKLFFRDIKTGSRYKLDINTYSPVTEIIEKPNAKNYLNKTYSLRSEHNDFSIMMSLVLGDYKILLCSDIENKTLEIVQKDLIYDDFFCDTINFLKIPHHTSKGSDMMLDLLQDVYIPKSVTTTYNCGDIYLPNRETLERYKKKSEKVYCTSSLDGNNIYNYGIVEVTTDIINHTVEVEEKKYDETVLR